MTGEPPFKKKRFSLTRIQLDDPWQGDNVRVLEIESEYNHFGKIKRKVLDLETGEVEVQLVLSDETLN